MAPFMEHEYKMPDSIENFVNFFKESLEENICLFFAFFEKKSNPLLKKPLAEYKGVKDENDLIKNLVVVEFHSGDHPKRHFGVN